MAEIFDPNAVSFDAQNAQLERQRKLTEYLRANSDRMQAPQGQMIGSGPGAQYVPPSWADMLVKPAAQLMAGYQQGQQGRAEDELNQRMGQHADEWRSSLPQATAAVKGMPANYVMESPEGQAGTPDVPGNPLTAERVLRHALSARGNPLLKGDADAYAKYSMMDIEAKQRQEAAAAEKAAQREFLDEQARKAEIERGEQKAADRALQQALLTQRMTTPNVNVRVSGGGGGEGGLGGAAPVIGADAAGNPIYRHQKSGALFQYDEVGAPVRYTGPVGAKPAAAKEPTEDQGKAAGWFKQAEKAFADMEAATREDPNASKPSLKELVAGAVPRWSAEAQTAVRSPARQRFTQGAEAMSEAVLRAATGAGVNKEEALQKVRELTPIYGESPSLTAQKRRSMVMYLDSLQVRAGRALTAPKPGAAVVDNDPLGIRPKGN